MVCSGKQQQQHAKPCCQLLLLLVLQLCQPDAVLAGSRLYNTTSTRCEA
jgi:hypothetical protein